MTLAPGYGYHASGLGRKDGLETMARIKAYVGAALASIFALVLSLPALADEAGKNVHGVAWGMGMQPAAAPSAERMHDFHELLLWIITIIAFFVLGLLLWVMYRYSEKQNPTPSKTTHHTLIEVIWTVVPVMILVIIAIPSFKLLYFEDQTVDGDITVKVIGNAWYWSFEYQDPAKNHLKNEDGSEGFSYEEFSFDANMLPEEEVKNRDLWLLAVDNVAYIPSNTVVRFIVTSSDTLHSFAMPAWGIKKDAVPGRLNETWTEVSEEWEGTTFYGQCSEICGLNHAYMPIAFKVVSRAEYEDWVKKMVASNGTAKPVTYAAKEAQ